MKKTISMMFGAALIAVGATAFAADTTPAPAPAAVDGSVKIGVLDVGKVLQESPQVKVAVDKLKAKFKERQDKIASAQKQLAADQEKLKRDKAVMKQADADDLQMKVLDEQRELQSMQEEYVRAARLAQNQVMGATLKQIDAIVKDISSKKHYDLILQRDNVAFASDKVDITPEVMAQLKDAKSQG
jgi:outer membrane protein